MAKKTYTAAEREHLREQLLDRGQALFARYGYRAAPLKEVYEPLGISKTFFYTFFPGKEALAIQVLCRQRTTMLERARDVVRAAPGWRAGLERVFDLFFHGSQNGVFTLELEDVQHLFRHMTPEEQREFWEGLSEFYRALLALWDIPASQQEYQLVQNMVSTLLLAYHSRLYASLPFAPGLEEETMSLQVKLIIDYLEDLHREHAAG